MALPFNGSLSPRKLRTFGSLCLALFLTAACTRNVSTPQRGIASEADPVQAEEAVSSYNLQEIVSTISATHSEAARGDLLGGFLAATAEEVINAPNLGEVISNNANRACVFLGHIHGKKHKRAVDYETSELVGPVMSLTSGQIRHERAVPISRHELRESFCQKVASFNLEEQNLYASRCLESGNIEVMPLHFKFLECDNMAEAAASPTQQNGRFPLYPNYTKKRGSSSPTTR